MTSQEQTDDLDLRVPRFHQSAACDKMSTCRENVIDKEQNSRKILEALEFNLLLQIADHPRAA